MPQVTINGGINKIFDKEYQKLLPKEYGGESECMEKITDDWINKMKKYAKYFEDEENYGLMELPTEVKACEKLFGSESEPKKRIIY